jgi:hypothetical protein
MSLAGSSNDSEVTDRAIMHRGLALPEGMSPALADQLERVICDGLEGSIFPLELGLECFRVISRNLAARPHD